MTFSVNVAALVDQPQLGVLGSECYPPLKGVLEIWLEDGTKVCDWATQRYLSRILTRY